MALLSICLTLNAFEKQLSSSYITRSHPIFVVYKTVFLESALNLEHDSVPPNVKQQILGAKLGAMNL